MKLDKKREIQFTANSSLSKVLVQRSADTLVVNQSLALHINPAIKRDGENRQLLEATKRYGKDSHNSHSNKIL